MTEAALPVAQTTSPPAWRASSFQVRRVGERLEYSGRSAIPRLAGRPEAGRPPNTLNRSRSTSGRFAQPHLKNGRLANGAG